MIEVFMSSQSLRALTASVSEIHELQLINTIPTRIGFNSSGLIRAAGRASVVLLCSHFEKYIHAINEEAADFINSTGITGEQVPQIIRLIHSRDPVEDLAETGWTRRANKLEQFVGTESWLWSQNMVGQIQPERILAFMKSPKPDNILRYYGFWGINDIFSAITRSQHTRSHLWLQIQTLVDKRNNIAHGDATSEANKREIGLYSRAVLTFCERSDQILSKQIHQLFGVSAPW
ncbi:MAE_28990/MAE_18760 family HEPN-like nuclease [Chloroflexota bacterium]